MGMAMMAGGSLSFSACYGCRRGPVPLLAALLPPPLLLLNTHWKKKMNNNIILFRNAAAASPPLFPYSATPNSPPPTLFLPKLTTTTTTAATPTLSPPPPPAGRKSRCYCTVAPPSSDLLDDEQKKMMQIKEAANTLDIRVGKILNAWRHEEADSLYVEEVDVGEAEPRIICSGLVKYIPLHHLLPQEEEGGINVVVLANLKPRNMRGVKSSGMLLAASDESHENVELLVPPQGSVPGQRIWFGAEEEDDVESLPEAASPNQIQKKKIWELVQPQLRTDDSCTAGLGEHTMRTTNGVIVCRSLKNARIS